ncbi:hypothetical protein ISN45_At05g027290 [Arabidopsis thaliana x Arabidopsis arenosa]|uniref:Uncharacterized protein n=1 Tax=Arabidopsis thaliana x Arabidopsis arenosa TaxID=1240361 RepID=A0A8T2CVZ4_9BRAS|nr:hypothetical protein ISN45_At05g027290 [Arabidopsis thaliana x Arabidopsis arenosa]
MGIGKFGLVVLIHSFADVVPHMTLPPNRCNLVLAMILHRNSSPPRTNSQLARRSFALWYSVLVAQGGSRQPLVNHQNLIRNNPLPTTMVLHAIDIGSGPTSYTQNSQFQQPLQNSNSFSFTRNYDLASYQAPPPPTPKSKLESLLEQILEGQQRILERPIPRWNESSLTTSWHSASMESCDEAGSTKLDIDLQNRSTHIDSVDRHHFGVDRHQYQPEEVSTFDGAESTEIDRAGSILDSSVDRHSPSIDRHWMQFAALNCQHAKESRVVAHVSIDTTTRVDRHTSLVEEESSPIATFQVGITAIRPSTTVTSHNAPLILHPPPKRLRYSSPPPKPLDIINKTLKFPKTILRLSKPRVSR